MSLADIAVKAFLALLALMLFIFVAAVLVVIFAIVFAILWVFWIYVMSFGLEFAGVEITNEINAMVIIAGAFLAMLEMTLSGISDKITGLGKAVKKE